MRDPLGSHKRDIHTATIEDRRAASVAQNSPACAMPRRVRQRDAGYASSRSLSHPTASGLLVRRGRHQGGQRACRNSGSQPVRLKRLSAQATIG